MSFSFSFSFIRLQNDYSGASPWCLSLPLGIAFFVTPVPANMVCAAVGRQLRGSSVLIFFVPVKGLVPVFTMLRMAQWLQGSEKPPFTCDFGIDAVRC